MNKIIFCTLLSAGMLRAADSTDCFNLTEYVPPAFTYHLLEFTPNFALSGGAGSSNDSQAYMSYDGGLYSNNSKHEFATSSPNIGIKARHTYYGWKGKTEWQINSSISGRGNLSLGPGAYTERDGSETPYFSSGTFFNGSAGGTFSVSAAHYFWKRFFIGAKISPRLSGGVDRSHLYRKELQDYWNSTDDSSTYTFEEEVRRGTSYDIGGYVNIRTGAGHIDDVTFAVVALNMLDRIAETEKSYKGCTGKNIQNLAALIEKRRKRRFFDARIAFIENIDTLCSFVKKNGIAEDLSPRTVLELADQWNYAFQQQRRNGFQIMLYPDADYSRRFGKSQHSTSACTAGVADPYTIEHNDKNEFGACVPGADTGYRLWQRVQDLNYGLNVQFLYERPLSRFYQLSLNSRMAAEVNRTWFNKWTTFDPGRAEKYSYAAPIIAGSESASLAYYPNTRTSITIAQAVEYHRTFDYYAMKRSGIEADELPSGSNFDNRHLMLSLTGNTGYYFSPQLQANVNAGVYWNDEYLATSGEPPWRNFNYKLNSDKRFNYSLGANVTWSIF